MKILSRVFIGLGLLLLLGTAGACDLDKITLQQTVYRILLSFILIGTGAYGYRFQQIKRRATYKTKRIRKTLTRAVDTFLTEQLEIKTENGR